MPRSEFVERRGPLNSGPNTRSRESRPSRPGGVARKPHDAVAVAAGVHIDHAAVEDTHASTAAVWLLVRDFVECAYQVAYIVEA